MAEPGNSLQIRDGYFWDPQEGQYFIARGVAYQTWNPPVFANQSLDQIGYDLREFVKLRANSVRAELVWGELEVEEDVYDWSRADFLIQTAEELGLKLFLLIGYQYPPLTWFPEEERCINDRGTVSDVLNYESPTAQAAYTEHIAAVVSRYKDSPAIGGWILGNEFAYFDLWEDPALYPARRMLGYDPRSLQAFREFLSESNGGDIASLNAKWGESYASFDEVQMPQEYPSDRNDPGYHDVIQWRKQSIANFLALGAKAAKDNDPNHLITYSMVGGIFSGSDANNTCEDPETIVRACEEIGAPLDFWSVNNYAWATEGSELRSADFGIAKYQEQIGLPILVSETGHSSTEDLLPGASPRQPDALPSTIWELLSSGAIGVHFFHWSDRHNFNEDFFIREQGFGIVGQNRLPKQPVYGNVEAMLRRMEEIDLSNLFGGSTDPPVDVLLYLTPEGDMGFPRGNQENTMIWGGLRRSGFQVGLIGEEAFNRGDFRDAQALVFSRSDQLKPGTLSRVESAVIPSGIHVSSNCDLPGQFNAYRQANPEWEAQLSRIFGVDVSEAQAVLNLGVSGGFDETYDDLSISWNDTPLNLLEPFDENLLTWKIWHGVRAVSGTTLLNHSGLNGSAPGSLALHVNDHGTARTAINTFAAGDIFGSTSATHLWDIRSSLTTAIYRDYFGIDTKIRLSDSGGPGGEGFRYVLADYRICRNGSVLISLLNEHDAGVSFDLHAPDLLPGKTVEQLSRGGILASNVAGTTLSNLSLAADELLLLYVYDENGGSDSSLIDPLPYRVWFEMAPQAVWPGLSDDEVVLGFDTRGEELDLSVSFESLDGPTVIHGNSPSTTASGVGDASLTVPIPDADLMAASYASTPNGGRYQLSARLEKEGTIVAKTSIPIKLLWGVRPVALPEEIVAGNAYGIEIEWQELPAYEAGEMPTSIDRAPLWDSEAAIRQHYNIRLELRDQSEAVVASDVFVTREASGRATLSIDVPNAISGPLHWFAYAETAPGASHDVVASFEGLISGAAVNNDARQEELGSVISAQADYSGQVGGADMSELPLSPFRTIVSATVDGTERTLSDDGNGLLLGAGSDTGTVDYDTGLITLNFSPPPVSGGGLIIVSYIPLKPNPDILQPWTTYTYGGAVYLNHGIHIEGFHGSQSAFMVIGSPPGAEEFWGFGVNRQFAPPIAIPALGSEGLNDFRFSFSFREEARHPARLELQIKDAQDPPALLIFTKDYSPTDDSWSTISASLDEFVQVATPPWSPNLFDHTQVHEITCNIAILERGVDYVASIDNIVFDAPEEVIDGGEIRAIYDSRNDSLLDTDRDGVADIYETGTGIFVSESDTGTDQSNPDTDGDGQSDGGELIAGTDPNSPADLFHVDEASMDSGGNLIVRWDGRAGRTYELEFFESATPSGGGQSLGFDPRLGFPPVIVDNDGPAQAMVPIPEELRSLLVRVRARMTRG